MPDHPTAHPRLSEALSAIMCGAVAVLGVDLAMLGVGATGHPYLLGLGIAVISMSTLKLAQTVVP